MLEQTFRLLCHRGSCTCDVGIADVHRFACAWHPVIFGNGTNTFPKGPTLPLLSVQVTLGWTQGWTRDPGLASQHGTPLASHTSEVGA